MTREQLEHIVRAAAYIVDDDELIVVGSQTVWGEFPDAPPAMLNSNEADVYPKNKPELHDVIDGTIGELSPFHETFGYYAHGVDPATAMLPEGCAGGWFRSATTIHVARQGGVSRSMISSFPSWSPAGRKTWTTLARRLDGDWFERRS